MIKASALRRIAVLAAVGATAAFAAASSGTATTTTAPDLGSPPFMAVAPAATFVAQISSATPTCPSATFGTIVCYSPSNIQQAYDVPTGHNAPTGVGQTILVLEAYGDPTLTADVASFDTRFGVPALSSLTVVNASAGGSGSGASGDTFGWAVETALDVEYAHAMAPSAAIVVGVAATDDIDDITAAAQQIIPRYRGSIISQSFGDDETDTTSFADFRKLHSVFDAATRAGDTILASTGDFGATDGEDYAVAAYPASDPLVTAVGGTQGNPYPGGLWRSGGYGGESVWNEGDTYDLASGGAPSVYFPAPSWEQSVTGQRMRTVPDVAFNAADNGGVLICVEGIFGTVGGTSSGPPQWAGIIALADELRARSHRAALGFVTDNLYAIASDRSSYRSDFHDITDGNNALDSDIGYSAGRGYDIPSGLGTPDVANLINDLAGRGQGNPYYATPNFFGNPFGHWFHRHVVPHGMTPGQ